MSDNLSQNSTFRLLVGVLFVVTIVATISLTLVLSKSGGSAAGVNREQVRAIITETLREDPQLIVDAFQQGRAEAERRQREQASKLAKSKSKELESNPFSPVKGAEDAKVTIVEFFDYRCGFCKRVTPTIDAVLSEHKDVKVVYKEYPVLGPQSSNAAIVSAAVAKVDKEKWFTFHDDMMKKSPSTQDQMLDLAAAIGLDRAKVKEAMESDEVKKYIQETNELGSVIGVRGTPAFLINGQLFPGAMSKEQFNAHINDARNRS